MNLRVVTGPSVEPVSVADVKLHCRISHSDEDSLLSLFIAAARRYAETYTHRAFVQRELELALDGFPCGGIIELPRGKVQSVSSIQYLDFDGVYQTLDASAYQTDLIREPARIKPAYLESWPVVTRADFNSVLVRYIAGFDVVGSPTDYASGVPENIKTWMLVRCATMYENREAVIVGTIVADLKHSFIDGLLDEFIVEMF